MRNKEKKSLPNPVLVGKRTEISDSSASGKKNMEKHALYSLAFERIDQALAAKFPVEAIAIEESIISDRLYSILKSLVPDFLKEFDGGIGPRLNAVRLCCWRDEDGGLLADVKQWIKRRNQAIHGIVASKAGGKAKQTPANFVPYAMSTARLGKKLSRRVDNWARKVKRMAEKFHTNTKKGK